MKDIYTEWRNADDGDLTIDETTVGLAIGPAPANGFDGVVIVPSVSTDDTLVVSWEESNALNGTYREIGRTKTISVAGKYPIKINNTLEYVRMVLNVTGSGVNLGAVYIGLDPGEGLRNYQQQGYPST